MSLDRINPADIYPPRHNNYTQVVRSTGTTQVHVAGLVPLNAQSELVGEGNMRLQVQTIIDSTGKALAAAGAKSSDVARINVFATDVDRYLREGHPEVLKFFEGHLPASTVVGVTRLADPRFLVEIEVTAVLD